MIVARREAGESYAAISRDLALPYITVRKVYEHYHQTGRLEASYAQCRPPAVRKSEAIYQKAIELKRNHSGWGAGLIWVELTELFEESRLPSVRTRQRWFHRAGVNRKASHDRVQSRAVQRGVRAHEVWALDAKEQILLGDGSYASWLTISDEGSGAVLSVTLFPPQILGTDRPAAGQASHPTNPDLLGETGTDTYG
jgi:hypothetical protein